MSVGWAYRGNGRQCHIVLCAEWQRLDGHRDVDYQTDNDVIYLINMTAGDHYGELIHLDLGNGNYPTLLEEPDEYGPFHPRGWTLSLLFEEADEDLNQNLLTDHQQLVLSSASHHVKSKCISTCVGRGNAFVESKCVPICAD